MLKWTLPLSNVVWTGSTTMAGECRRETGLILRCDWKVGNPFQTKQGSRPSCPDQEGRKGSEEGVPENLGVPLEGDRDFGEFVGRIKGAKCPFDLQFLTWDFS